MRRSANRVLVSTIDRFVDTQFLAENRKTTSSIETINIDNKITELEINIFQYNKESGWGKFRNDNWSGTPSFSVPADRKPRMKDVLIDGMHDEIVSVDSYFVRCKSGQPIRLIVTDINAASRGGF